MVTAGEVNELKVGREVLVKVKVVEVMYTPAPRAIVVSVPQTGVTMFLDHMEVVEILPAVIQAGDRVKQHLSTRDITGTVQCVVDDRACVKWDAECVKTTHLYSQQNVTCPLIENLEIIS